MKTTILAPAAFLVTLAVLATPGTSAPGATQPAPKGPALDTSFLKQYAETRGFTRRFFERAGFEVAPSETNFLMVHIRRPIEGFRKACEAAGVAVGRPFPPLDRHARITIGTADEMRLAVGVFGRVLAA